MYCKACGETLYRAMIFALLIDYGGARGRDPSECPATADHEHEWVESEQAAEGE